MLLRNTNSECQTRLHNARRFFSLVPLLVFLLTLMLFSSSDRRSYMDLIYVLLHSLAATMASVLISIAAYGFYRYLTERSPGL
jgi:hypothetical protein